MLANFLERPAGEVAIGFALMGVGAALWWFKIPHGDDSIVAGLTLISRGIVGQVSTKPSSSPASTPSN